MPWRRTVAGAQVEEPLADAVRSALAAAIASDAPPRPAFGTIEERLAYLRWLGGMSERLKKRKADHEPASSSSKPSGTRASAPGSSRRWCSG